MQTAKLTGEPMFAKLAGRYMHEAGQTELAITYLSTMEKSAKNAVIKKTYSIRLQALQAVRSIESARDAYRQDSGRLPASVEELMRAGYLKKLPADPYGGRFYIELDGKVNTTSKFAFMIKAQ
jgi:competence protein ComGC